MATFALSFNDNMLSVAAMDDIETGGKQEHHGVGHRERLCRRLFDGGPDALLDHELIEYLLALAIPRRDTKPLAKQLLTEFGSIGGLLTADSEALKRVNGMGETRIAALKIAHAAALRLIKSQVRDQPVMSSWQALPGYSSEEQRVGKDGARRG